MNVEQETNHAFARSHSNAGLGDAVCANPSCAYHQKLPYRDKQAYYVRMIEDGHEVCVNRHLYRGKENEFYLCDICHEAVQMVVSPNV